MHFLGTIRFSCNEETIIVTNSQHFTDYLDAFTNSIISSSQHLNKQSFCVDLSSTINELKVHDFKIL